MSSTESPLAGRGANRTEGGGGGTVNSLAMSASGLSRSESATAACDGCFVRVRARLRARRCFVETLQVGRDLVHLPNLSGGGERDRRPLTFHGAHRCALRARSL